MTVFPDDNKKYLSTDLLREEPIKDGFLSPDVELLGFGSMKRVCKTCCDPTDCKEDLEALAIAAEDLPPCPRREQPEFCSVLTMSYRQTIHLREAAGPALCTSIPPGQSVTCTAIRNNW